VADQAATGATTQTERTRRAAARPSPSEASGLRSAPRAPTLQPQAATRTAGEERAGPPSVDRPLHLAEPDSARRTAQPGSTSLLAAGVRMTNVAVGFVAVCFDGPSGPMPLYR
jgi:hypothetical protein